MNSKMKVFLVMALVALTLVPSFAAVTGNITISGIMPSYFEVSITATTEASALDLTTTQTSLKIADIYMKSNARTGYKVTLTSQYLGVLKGAETDNPEPNITYKLYYGSTELNVSGGSVVLASGTKTTKDGAGNVLNIAYTGDFYYADTYSDKLTVNISAP